MTTSAWSREDVESVAAYLGDDAAKMRNEGDAGCPADNMDRAASMLTWMLLTHPIYASTPAAPAPEPTSVVHQKPHDVRNNAVCADSVRHNEPPPGAAFVDGNGKYFDEQAEPLAEPTEAQPVAKVLSWTSGSYWRNYKLEWMQDVPEGTMLYTHAAAAVPPEMTQERIRSVGGIVHSDGNIFFTNIAQLNRAIAERDKAWLAGGAP